VKDDLIKTGEVKGSVPVAKAPARARVLDPRFIGPELWCLRGGGDVLSDDSSTALLLIACLGLEKTRLSSLLPLDLHIYLLDKHYSPL
jgi:hypothetical protein